jgi:hypothetical protein
LPFSILCHAQSRNGKLTGKVTDAATNEPLSGVSITIKGRKAGVASITDGTYIFSLAPGSYTISVSYLSYQKKELSDVIIKAGQTTFLDIILSKKDDKLLLKNAVLRPRMGYLKKPLIKPQITMPGKF